MEVLTGDRNIPDPAAAAEEQVFPAHISPFSETHQVVFANPTAAAMTMTPQKLRIRCNGRSPAVDAAPTLPDDADPPQLGSADNGLSPHNADEHFKAQGVEFVNWKQKRKRTSSCSSSSTRKKSKRLEMLEHFLESLVNKMMEKQEQMHKQLIEMVQDREKERIAKEEAWKQHELERITRDEEVRAQQTSRSLALINFVQSLLGSDVQVPQPAPLVAQPVATVQPPTSNQYHDQRVKENKNLHKDTAIAKCIATPTDKRWLQFEIRALIALRTSLEHKFRTPINSSHGSLWEEIALGMNRMGFDRSGRKCKEKWENMNKYFKRAITNDKKRPTNAKTCQYFYELELLYKNGLLNLGNGFSPTSSLGNGFSCTNNQKETRSENESQQCVLSNVDTSLLTCATIPSVLNSNEAAERTRAVVSPAL
ncbi:putative transcription factor MYB family [Rosa chinensis]|uniref:Putative transcription factor MYB family n=1 Tax=Rosa chinensis TaxID=74649 RepID=A0A2P6Q207_ROSCH|nr:trihelix transcription factor GTL1 [Rosa chinensis]PRQ28205.1 putative transcription factor MYB family [Rosa chinensis]